jgi:hypothetical protein
MTTYDMHALTKPWLRRIIPDTVNKRAVSKYDPTTDCRRLLGSPGKDLGHNSSMAARLLRALRLCRLSRNSGQLSRDATRGHSPEARSRGLQTAAGR